MPAQCWLHIGTEKTGSTSIQNFLAQNRAALRVRGLLYSEAPGVRSHSGLVAYSLDDDRHDSTREVLGVPRRVPLDTFRQRLSEGLEREVVASGTRVVLLSNELLATRLRRPTEIARLKGLCDRLARETRVIVYLRNQTDFFASRYTNVVWEGGTRDFDFRASRTIGDYERLLDRWSDAFGKENLVVRRFEPAEFPAGDVIGDFARVIGLDISGLDLPARANPSLDAESLAFLRAMNRRLPPGLAARVQPFRGAIVRVLQRRRGGKKFAIPREVAKRIADVYRDSNARVAREYFGSGPLFSPPVLVSDSPAPPGIGVAAILGIGGFLAMGLLREATIRAARRLLRRD